MTGELLGPQHLALREGASQHPAAQVISDRVQAGSVRGERDDGYSVALVIEGGGTAGIVTAGMCVAFEALGLISAIDKIYGTSAGGLNGVYTAAGQAAAGTTNYEDIITNPAFYQLKRLFLPGPAAVDMDYLVNDRIAKQNPLDLEALAEGPEFATVSVNLGTMAVEVLSDFSDHQDRLGAVRASCSMPVLSGRHPFMYRGKPMTDGAMLASVPVAEALAGGATHVVALRSRGEDYEKEAYPSREVRFTRLYASMGAELAKLMKDRPEIYNRAAGELRRGEFPSVMQITPAVKEPVAQFEKSLRRAYGGFLLGAIAVGKTFGTPDVSVSWGQVPAITAVA